MTYGVAKQAAGVDYRTAPTIQISERGGRSLYVELRDSRTAAQSKKEQTSSRTSRPAKRLASFHSVKDGRDQMRNEHLACAESCAFLGIFFYFISPHHSPTTGTSSTNNSSDLLTLY